MTIPGVNHSTPSAIPRRPAGPTAARPQDPPRTADRPLAGTTTSPSSAEALEQGALVEVAPHREPARNPGDVAGEIVEIAAEKVGFWASLTEKAIGLARRVGARPLPPAPPGASGIDLQELAKHSVLAEKAGSIARAAKLIEIGASDRPDREAARYALEEVVTTQVERGMTQALGGAATAGTFVKATAAGWLAAEAVGSIVEGFTREPPVAFDRDASLNERTAKTFRAMNAGRWQRIRKAPWRIFKEMYDQVGTDLRAGFDFVRDRVASDKS